MDAKEKSFDLITMWDVLEHIDDADKVVEKCSEITKMGGYIVIQVPQIDSFVAKWKKENWNMMGLDHVNYFSKRTIVKLLEKEGFETVKIESSIELKLFLMYTVLPWLKKRRSKQNGAPVIDAAERQEYFNKTTNQPKWVLKIMIFIHNICYNLLSTFGIGEEMIVIAKKV